MKKTFTIITTLIVLLFTNLALYAQRGDLKGFVYDNETGEPMPYVFIQLQGTSYGAMSEKNGAFMITKVPHGEYLLTVAYLGYDTVQEKIAITPTVLTKNIYMNPSKVSLDAVQITAGSQRVLTETRTSVISVTAKDIKKMPSIGGSPDFAQYLQVLPGVVSTGDQGGQVYVRGGTLMQNMLLLDGMLIYNPFHSIGLFSVFDSELISSADVYTGGFGAEFGGRVSSVMDIRTKDGNKKRIAGKVDVNTFGAKLLLEGPFIKKTPEKPVSMGYVLSLKGSYLEESSKVLYPYVEGGLPYNYFDFYGKISLETHNGSKVNIFGFNFDDKVNYTDIATYSWKNWGLGTNFLLIPGSTPMMIEGTIAYTNYYTYLDDRAYKPSRMVEMTSTDTNARQSSLDGFNANMKFTYYFGHSQISFGPEFVGYSARYVFYQDTNINSRVEKVDHTTDIGLFVKYKYNFRDKLLIEPSFRLQYYSSLGVSSPEPRLSMKYNITKKIRLKFAGGWYSQNLVGATSDRDVVNLFSAFLSSPSGLPDTDLNGKEVLSSLQKAQHLILGLELDVIPYTSINIEGYLKNFSVITSLNRYKMFNEDPDYMFEKGKAYGGDFTMNFEYRGLNIRAIYSLGWVKRFDGQIYYAPHFDRRHNINLLCSYGFGKRRSWTIDVRWNYGSGFPFTQTQAYYPNLHIGAFDMNYATANESLAPMYSAYNQGKLPAYHRLDISASKSIRIGERHAIDISAGITNVYNQKNIFYKDRITNETIYQLPILYTLGLSWNF